MLNRKTVLVLGAGASVAFGFPTGEGLREQITAPTWREDPERLQFAERAGLLRHGEEFDKSALADLVSRFHESRCDSIDAFLGDNSAYLDIGRRTIAAFILRYELPKLLHGVVLPGTGRKDKWCQHLWNKLIAGGFGNLSFENLSVVTFNYDRSLEIYLCRAIMGYGLSEREALQRLESLRIVHVYGSLGSIDPDSDRFVSFGGLLTQDRVAKAAESVVIIPEGRDTDQSLQQARHLIEEARTAVFLGFRFDETNVRRLGGTRIGAYKDIPPPAAGNGFLPQIVASCLGMTDNEAIAAARSVGVDGLPVGFDRLPRGWHRADCEMTLRETNILSA